MSVSAGTIAESKLTEKVVLGGITGDKLGLKTVAFAALACHAGLRLWCCFWNSDGESSAGECNKADKLAEEHNGGGGSDVEVLFGKHRQGEVDAADDGGVRGVLNEHYDEDNEIYLYKPHHGVGSPASYLRHASVLSHS